MAGLLDNILGTPYSGGLFSFLNGPQLGTVPQIQQAQVTPSAFDPWAGIRGVNEQPPGTDNALLPSVARPTEMQGSPQSIPSPQSPTQPGMQVPAILQDNGNNLTAGLAGFANSRGLLPALTNMFSGFATGQRTDPVGMQQQMMRATYQSLVASGVPQSQAMAAALNPEVMKAITPEYFGGYKIVQTGESPVGKQYAMQGPGGKLYPIGGASGPGSIPGGQGNADSSVANPVGLLAPGVKQYDPNLSGDAYLQQFGPEVQAAVKAYMRGDVMPTGNPRVQGLANFAKLVAQKYGQDTGQPVSDATYSSRRQFQQQLGSGTASSIGGQVKSFNQGISHMADLADTLMKLDNSNGLGIPVLADLINTGRQMTSTEQSALSDKAKAIGQTVAGEVGKLFSGTAGGGVHERELTRDRFSTVKSPAQLAAALEGTIEMMEGGLHALESRRDEVMGPNSGIDFVSQETKQNIAKIQNIISQLRGGQKAQAQPATNGLPAGWSVKVQ